MLAPEDATVVLTQEPPAVLQMAIFSAPVELAVYAMPIALPLVATAGSAVNPPVYPQGHEPAVCPGAVSWFVVVSIVIGDPKDPPLFVLTHSRMFPLLTSVVVM